MERDKLLHFVACEMLALIVTIVALFIGLGVYAAPLGFIVALAAGVVKELLDRKTTGFDRMDLAADFLGAFAALVLASLIFTLAG